VLLTKHNTGDQSKMNETDGTCGTYGVGKRSIQSLGGGKPEGRRRLGRYRRILQDNITINMQEREFRL
jgi:hypothetical protein